MSVLTRLPQDTDEARHELAALHDKLRRAGASPPKPDFDDGLPRCVRTCPNHDGKRCSLLGYDAPDLCEPQLRLDYAKLATHS